MGIAYTGIENLSARLMPMDTLVLNKPTEEEVKDLLMGVRKELGFVNYLFSWWKYQLCVRR